MPEHLKNFPVVIDIPVAWGEMDSMQHVNNIVYFRYFESVRMAYFERIDYIATMQRTGHGPILASTKATFRFPLTYPDTVSVGCKVSELQTDRFVMEFLILSQKQNEIAARGEGVIVSYDYHHNRKVSLPQKIREQILTLEKDLTPAS